MEAIEQENTELREEITTLRADMERLNALVDSLVVAQNQPLTPRPLNTKAQTTVISEIVTTPVSVAPVNTLQYTMPEGYPWGMPYNLNGGYWPIASEVQPVIEIPTVQYTTAFPQPGMTVPQATIPVPQPIMTVPAPMVHTIPHENELVYQAEPTESIGAYGRMDDFQDQFDEMQREIKALRGKDLFGKNAHDLCLVPNVKIPTKFKVPDFEKYKRNSCPQSHLVMYARKMSTQTDNHQLLIHYFQDSLTGAALKWYMSLDSTNIRTFNDLGEAFIRQYRYNLDMAPDRDQLRAMAQKDKETFKEYAQRWREIAAQINPTLEEKEMTKIFLKTLGSFYYERMIASAPNDFTEMVNMGMRLEEGVREGRLAKESGSSCGTRKFGTSFPKKKEQEVSMVAQGRPRRNYYQQQQHVTTLTPVVGAVQNPGHQPQFQQRPQPQFQ
ncbi:hypothetical protein QL285_008189 [Trifolium repens]|nr:hypothetical protein QL285_008189 [Trifolium repens]